MGNEYNGELVILRDKSGNQMSLARFFELALVSDDGHGTTPSGGEYYPSGSIHNAWDMHTSGLDGVVPSRTPVSGTVVSAYNDGGYHGGAGNWVVIKEDTSGSSLSKERYHRFMHHHSTIVSEGDTVQQGDQLGWIGTTGNSTGCHLHYDVCLGGYDASQKIADPIQAYDNTTLPENWNMTDASKAADWNYIPLDDTATDYGPPGGSPGGSEDDPGGGSDGSYTEVVDVTVDIIPPKKIYFSPVPGLIDSDKPLDQRKETITITTDAEPADLYYTLDGSSPYTYYQNGEQIGYAVAKQAISYTEPVTIHTDTHIRVVAVPPGSTEFDKPLAKGSGTFLFKYKPVIHKWEDDQKSYALKDDKASFFEENRQAFLLLHETATDEEIQYSEVYKHDNQIEEDNAKDNASQASGTATNSEEI